MPPLHGDAGSWTIDVRSAFFHAGQASIALIRESGLFARQAAWTLANMLIRIKRELENSLFP
jgi:hypothetical protein